MNLSIKQYLSVSYFAIYTFLISRTCHDCNQASQMTDL